MTSIWHRRKLFNKQSVPTLLLAIRKLWIIDGGILRKHWYLSLKSTINLAAVRSIAKGTGGSSFIALSFFKSTENSNQSIENKLLLAEVDKLHDESKEAEAYSKLQSVLAASGGQSAEIYWRLAREARALANSATASEDERKRLNYEAFDMAQRGLQLDPSSGSCHKWVGIMLELTSRYEGIKKRIQNSFLVKEHFVKAIEQLPNDAVVLYCLGAWCFEVTDLPWYQKKIAATFFAAPPTSTFEEALEYFLRAEDADPNFYSSNLLYIGKAYLRLANKDKAREYLLRAASYNGDSHDDKQSKEEANNLLKKL